MFAEIRVALHVQRAVAHSRRFKGEQNPPKPLMVRDILYCATMGGATCAGLADKVGSLTPGKEADVLVIRADDINLYASNNAIGSVVQAAERSNVETVIIGGRVRKYGGRVVDLDMGRVKALVEESRSQPICGRQLSSRHFCRAAAEVVVALFGATRRALTCGRNFNPDPIRIADADQSGSGPVA